MILLRMSLHVCMYILDRVWRGSFVQIRRCKTLNFYDATSRMHGDIRVTASSKEIDLDKCFVD